MQKDKPTPCMACGRRGHYAFECPGLQYLGNHPNLPEELEVSEKKAAVKSGPERKEDISEEHVWRLIPVSPTRPTKKEWMGSSWIPCDIVYMGNQDDSAVQAKENRHEPYCLCLSCNGGPGVARH